MDIEAMTKIVKSFLEFYVISELLIEGGFNPLDPEEMVYVKFGVIDKDDRRADENQQIQIFHGNLRTVDEVRKSLGDTPWTEEALDRTFFKMYEEPLALLKGAGPGTAASETLANHPSSNLTPEAVKKEKVYAEQTMAKQLKAKQAQGRPASRSASSGSRSASASKARPANQHGQRSAPKTNRDLILQDSRGNEITIT